jgi:hypothetical protein
MDTSPRVSRTHLSKKKKEKRRKEREYIAQVLYNISKGERIPLTLIHRNL